MKINRRKLLKASGTGLATTAFPLGVAGRAAAQNRSDDFVGLSYHSFSHESQGPVKATLQTDAKQRLSGSIQAAGYTIPVKQIAPKTDRNGKPVYYGRSTKSDHIEDGEPLTFKLTDHGPFMAGYLTRPTSSHAKVGITVHDSTTGVSAADIRKTLIGEGKGVGRGTIESTGIPDAVEPEEQS